MKHEPPKRSLYRHERGVREHTGAAARWAIASISSARICSQLDGTNPVGFDVGPSWTSRVLSEIRLVGPYAGLHPAATFVRTLGCYAYQIDTAQSSYLIVFEARTV